jgi:glutathionylspermidine synthase
LNDEVESLDLTSYRERRDRFFRRFGALWPGTLLEPYDLLEVYPLPASEIAAITEAAEAIGLIYNRTATLLRTVPDEALLQMGLPREVLDLTRQQITTMPDTVLGRLDLARTADGYKLLEFNADTPGLVIETFPINAKVCDDSGTINPNEPGETELKKAFERAILAGIEHIGRQHGEMNVGFTCSTSKRDHDITEYLPGLLSLPAHIHTKFVPVESLRTERDGLYDADGNRVDVLYRFYPLHILNSKINSSAVERNIVNTSGSFLKHLVADHKLAIINPPSAFLLECKATQSVIWNLAQTGVYFTEAERLLIERHFLPTYMDPVFKDEPYVVKPVYGTEGDTITIVDPGSKEVVKSNNTTYLEQPMIYQKYIELPRAELMTEEGRRSLSLLTSCFLIDGKATGITLRAGDSITNFAWWSVPVCVSSTNLWMVDSTIPR